MPHVPSARGCRTQCGSQLGAVFKEAGGSAFAQDLTCAKSCLQVLLLPASFSPPRPPTQRCSCILSCARWLCHHPLRSPRPLLWCPSRREKGERLVQSFRWSERCKAGLGSATSMGCLGACKLFVFGVLVGLCKLASSCQCSEHPACSHAATDRGGTPHK